MTLSAASSLRWASSASQESNGVSAIAPPGPAACGGGNCVAVQAVSSREPIAAAARAGRVAFMPALCPETVRLLRPVTES